jgi:antiviral helicase SKI2
MLYRGADLIRDIEFVVFDEVHYVNDSERGVVWEEVIIMLPAQVNLIFLSATTPNTFEFSDWIGRTKRRMVHVVKTDYRPVPLSHFLWAGNKLHLILHGKGGFLDGGYSDAANALQPKKTKADGKVKPQPPKTGSKLMAWQAQGTKQHWISLIRFLDREFLTPTVIFSFSKKKCEEIADMLRSLDLNTEAERGSVQGFTLQAIARLSSADAKLPQVLAISEMATRGIGVHHGGLLPILKEYVSSLERAHVIGIVTALTLFLKLFLFYFHVTGWWRYCFQEILSKFCWRQRPLLWVLICQQRVWFLTGKDWKGEGCVSVGPPFSQCYTCLKSVRKHDGTQFRQLEPGEYTQMAGRAGRRGLDEIGTVIICCFGETPPPQPMLRSMLTGKSTLLKSQFRLTYNMILNLLRVEDMSVESMIKRSFSEFATQRALTTKEYPQLLERGTKALAKLESQLSEELRLGAEDLEDYFSVCRKILSTSKEVLTFLFEADPGSFDELLQPGRMILVSAARQFEAVRAPAVVLKLPTKANAASLTGPKTSSTSLVCLILLPCCYIESHRKDDDRKIAPAHIGYIGSHRQRYYSIQEIDLGQILAVSTTKSKIDVKLLYKEDSSTNSRPSPNDNFFSSMTRSDPFSGMKALGKSTGGAVKVTKEDEMMDQVINHLLGAEEAELGPSGVPMIDLQSFVKRGNDVIYYREACDRIRDLHAMMRTFQSHRHPSLEKWYKEIERRETLRERVQLLEHTLSNESLSLFPDFMQRKAVLRELGYLNENETVTVKGRVACEVNTCEELIVSEMIFDGVLNNMAPEEIVACLSALVFQERKDEDYSDNTALPARLIECCEKMKEIAVQLGQVQKENGLAIDPADYCDRVLKFGLVHVVYEWACGVSFASICMLTEVQEGSIVRAMTRLDELCREVRNCARVIGNPTLYRKMEAAGETIKRDIVFASSLYVS